jgi:hypothetical protein
MAGKVFFSQSMSLDGFVAPEGHMGEPDWTARWMNCSGGYSPSGSSGRT